MFIATNMLPLNQSRSSIDRNVLLMIAGTMGLVALFIESKMPSLLDELFMEKVPNVRMAAVALSLFAGMIPVIACSFAYADNKFRFIE